MDDRDDDLADTTADRQEFLHDSIDLALRFAMLAPSPRNIQPWTFRVDEVAGVIDLLHDQDRVRPVADPQSRELVISCGVALYFCRLALASLGAYHTVELAPGPQDAGPLATITITGEVVAPDEWARELVAAAMARRTSWNHLIEEPVFDEDLEVLKSAAQDEGAVLRVIEIAERTQIEYLIAVADERQQADPEFAAELGRWPTGRPGADSAPESPQVTAERESPAGTIVALSTVGDGPEHWMVAGQALGNVLLTATGLGLSVTFVNQPIQQPPTRGLVARALGVTGDIQQLLRIGFDAQAIPETPRLPFADIVKPMSD